MKDKYLIPTTSTVHEIVHSNEIVYITISDKYSSIKLKNGKKLFARRSLKQFENILPVDAFCRVHKAYIIALAYVTRVEADTIQVDDEKIPLGRQFKDAFLREFNIV